MKRFLSILGIAALMATCSTQVKQNVELPTISQLVATSKTFQASFSAD